MTKKVTRSATLRDPVVIPPRALVGAGKRRYPVHQPEINLPVGASTSALTASAPSLSAIVMLSRLTTEERQALDDEMEDLGLRIAAEKITRTLEDDPLTIAAWELERVFR